MNVLDLIIDANLVFTGSEGRRLISHGCVFLLPEWWEKGDNIPDHVMLITDPNYILQRGDIINVHKMVYRYDGDDTYTLIQDRRQK